MSENIERHDDNDSDEQAKRKRLRLEMLNELKAANNTIDTENATNDYSVEIARYLAFMDVGQTGDCLKFWKCHTSDFPILAQVAQTYLATSASSVPVESMFSTCGLVMNSRRSALSADKLNKIVFIHDNFKFTV